ncbi:MAG TPA: malto-oligosyltrehalose trehalohydrolase, partial [Labilithrix sp.]|nr:malto-oligosyltrehalose trehalohydrolase [Labilithrix sp.]
MAPSVARATFAGTHRAPAHGMTARAESFASDSVDGHPPQLGATPTPRGVHFALFATTATSASVRLFEADMRSVRATVPLRATAPHVFEGEVEGIGAGALYKFVLDGRELPDPYARFLPDGVHGVARVEPRHVARSSFEAPPLHRWVIYELHVGTFTPEGTYRAAAAKVDYLADLGINVIELMPVASFAGARGWGYDGVAVYAPFAGYGEPDDLRALVEAAHARNIVVLLDVVYNHLGPSGNYLCAYAPDYFTAKHQTAWGDAPNYADIHMRRLVIENVRYWFEQFDFDGLRLDATHGIVDESVPHILAELARVARSCGRRRILIAEDERNLPALVEEDGLDAIWADDFHHALHVTLTGERDGYYAAYEGGAAELARVIEKGWLYEGQVYAPTEEPRGRRATLSHEHLVYCIQNHDQVGNRALGNRLTEDVSLEAFMGASLLLLFLPALPLIFMGQEWAATTPFIYFTDHEAELGAAVTRGRRDEFKKFRAFHDPTLRERIPDPQALSTFERSKLRWSERSSGRHAEVLSLYRKMLHLRAHDAVLSSQG